ncbi:unnamed protein product [Strongylus vulgaris]|uniref:Uncharacterized protein n=1 Tax=Strongylus vulgaris TaxID=40348 RepID=A0A3P7L2T7_STRVU|nr:unnamed protein product [Strongylus vulgaris]
MPRTRNLKRILKAIKDVLERRRLRLDPIASHLERLIGTTQLCKIFKSTGNLGSSTRKEKSKEVAQGPSRLLCFAKTGLAHFHDKRESITMSNTVIPTGKIPPLILPAELRAAIQSM